MKIKTKDYLVKSGENVHLNKWDTKTSPIYKSKDEYKEIISSD